MLNDAICFKAVYIVCGYTDLRADMDRLAALVETQTGNRPYIKDISFLREAHRPHQGACMGRGQMAPAIQAALRKPVPVAAHPGGST